MKPRLLALVSALVLALGAGLPALAADNGPLQLGGGATALPVQVTNNPKLGPILTDSQGMTLYILSSEQGGTFKCVARCLTVWPPLLAPSGTAPSIMSTGSNVLLGVVTRPDGTSQITYNGFPLYRFSRDKAPGDTNGNGIHAFEGVWLAARAGAFPLAAGAVTASVFGNTGSFTVSFVSAEPGQGEVLFGSGPGCSGLVEVATQDQTPGTNGHTVTVTGNDLPGSVGDNGIQPGATYSYMVVTVTSSGMETNDNGGQCFTVTIPSA